MYNTKQHNLKQNKLDMLLKTQRNLFHTKDLSLLWGTQNKNTLYTTIKRYVQKGILIRIQKGFYSKMPLEKVDPVELGVGFLHSFAYLSTETILSQQGIISQFIPCFTLISPASIKFQAGNNCYVSRQLNDKFLFNQIGIIEKNNISQATTERAVADILYFNSTYHFDAPNLVNWSKVKEIQKAVGYKK